MPYKLTSAMTHVTLCTVLTTMKYHYVRFAIYRYIYTHVVIEYMNTSICRKYLVSGKEGWPTYNSDATYLLNKMIYRIRLTRATKGNRGDHVTHTSCNFAVHPPVEQLQSNTVETVYCFFVEFPPSAHDLT